MDAAKRRDRYWLRKGKAGVAPVGPYRLAGHGRDSGELNPGVVAYIHFALNSRFEAIGGDVEDQGITKAGTGRGQLSGQVHDTARRAPLIAGYYGDHCSLHFDPPMDWSLSWPPIHS